MNKRQKALELINHIATARQLLSEVAFTMVDEFSDEEGYKAATDAVKEAFKAEMHLRRRLEMK